MHDYDPSLQQIPLRQIVVAWAVAMATVAILLVLPEFVQRMRADSAEVGMKTAIEQTIPPDTDLFANSR